VYQVRGLSLHDLRFRGQRIVYEMASQELYVSYNGNGGAPDRR
jgi:Copper amine oxidase, enzyme domain